MIQTVDVETSSEQIVMLERGALDRWGKGDPKPLFGVYLFLQEMAPLMASAGA